MKEIELKVLEIDKRAVEKKLRALGAKKVFTELMRVRFFDFPDGRIRARGDLLRLREIGKNRTEYVYKTNKRIKGGCKVFDENEFLLEGDNVFEDMTRALKSIGLKQTVYYEKKRTLYVYKKWKFEIDEHPRIPVFMEIEAPSPRAVKEAIKMLGLENHEATPDTINGLLKRRYKGVKLNGLTFKNHGK